VGYLTLDEIPVGRLCRPIFIPDDPMWLALFGGALTELTFPYNYQQFGTLTPQEMADACAEVIAEWYEAICQSCELPEGEPIMRIGLDGVLEQLIDGAWSPPAGDYFIPPPEAREESTAEERRCLAAANAANVLKLMYEEITDEYGTGLGYLEAITTFAVFVIGLIAPPVGLVTRALALLALAAWQVAFDTAEFVTADFWTSAFDENIRCALFRSSVDTDGVVTFNFEQVNYELIYQVNWIDPTGGSFALAAQVRWMLGQITGDGLNLAGATTAITEADCSDCDETPCRDWNFRDTDGGWFFVRNGSSEPLASYDPGEGWRSAATALNTSFTIQNDSLETLEIYAWEMDYSSSVSASIGIVNISPAYIYNPTYDADIIAGIDQTIRVVGDAPFTFGDQVRLDLLGGAPSGNNIIVNAVRFYCL